MSLLAQITVFAHDNGEGLVGETDDQIITFFSLGLVVFFTVVVILGSVIQGDPGEAQGPAQGRRAAPPRRLVGVLQAFHTVTPGRPGKDAWADPSSEHVALSSLPGPRAVLGECGV